jgi:putative oxidoreductase
MLNLAEGGGGAKGMLLGTSGGWAPLFLRLTLAIVMFPHGAQKMLGWFGGSGYSGSMQFFTETLGIPYFFALLAFIAEFFGPIALLLGLLTRVAAFGIGMVMLVATVKFHAANGFFMNWMGNQQGEGFEYHILVMGIALALIIAGAGRLSVDGTLAGKK